MKRRTPARGGNGRTQSISMRKTSSKASAQSQHSARRKKRAVVAIVIILAIILTMFAGVFFYLRMLAGRMHYVDPGKETVPDQYNPPTESLVNPVPSVKEIINILLLGVDTRSADSFGERSDAMMILTIDKSTGKIKLASLQRDMLVYIPGVRDPQKINAANSLGGPMLAVRVVNETFRLDIKRYMVVNMQGMKEIVDLAGGVWIDVRRAEIPHINPRPEAPGRQKLNGSQAVSYSRIRAIDSDYGRMNRQRTVIQALLDVFMQADLVTKNNMISEGLDYITTNMSVSELLDVGLNIIPKLDTKIEQLQIPIKGYFREYSGKSWVNLCDFNGMIPLLHEFIFGRTYPFDPVKIIPGAPNSGVALPSPKATTTAGATEEITTTTFEETTAGDPDTTTTDPDITTTITEPPETSSSLSETNLETTPEATTEETEATTAETEPTTDSTTTVGETTTTGVEISAAD